MNHDIYTSKCPSLKMNHDIYTSKCLSLKMNHVLHEYLQCNDARRN